MEAQASQAITLRTGEDLRRLQIMVTPKRFKELCNDQKVEELDEAYALKILTHLRSLSEAFAHFNSSIISWHEGFDHPGINARGQAAVTPVLIDYLSRKSWPHVG